MEIKEDIIVAYERYKELQIRNPILNINGFKIGIIGDVHIGKTFRTGVPKHRLGERELMVLSQLTELLNRDVDYTVLVGDLFDKIRVSNTDLLRVIDIIENAVRSNPSIHYVVINGNHDMPKEVDRRSSFQIFEKYFSNNNFNNLKIVSTNLDTNIVEVKEHGVLLYFSHYNPFLSLDSEVPSEVFNTIDRSLYPIRIAFGHWETIDFGSDHFIDRDVPSVVLENFNLVVTGHEHKPKLTIVDNVPVLTSGSMQPYAYGEELPEETSFYRTLTTSQVNSCLEKDPEYFKDSYIRILTEVGDDLPENFECLSRTYKPIVKKVENKKTTDSPLTESDDPLSFQNSFHQLVKQLIKDDPSNEQILSHIEKTFLDKSYKENT